MPRHYFLLPFVLLFANCSHDAQDPAASQLSFVQDSIAPLRGGGNRIVPGRYLVRFKAGVGDEHASAHAALAGLPNSELLGVFTGVKGFYARLSNAALDAIRHNPNIESVDYDIYLYAAGDQNVSASSLWGLDRIDQRSYVRDNNFHYDLTGSGVHLYILDTGLDPSVPELSGRVGTAITTTGDDPWNPCRGHGTWVATAAAGAVHGVAKGATVHAVRITAACDTFTTTGYAGLAINWVKDNGARPAVINFSFAGQLNCGFFGCGNLYEDQVRNAVAAGVTFVAGAGNANGVDACNFTPARVSEAITVGATDSADQRVSFSNQGSCVDIYAPGLYIGASNIGGAETLVSGTSIATPLVAGAAALYLQYAPQASPSTVWYELNLIATHNVVTNIAGGNPTLLFTDLPGPPAATINGPNVVASAGYCTWTPVVHGGTAPLTYQWSGVLSGTAGVLNGSVSQSGTLTLTVTDARARVSQSSLWISVDESSQSCPF